MLLNLGSGAFICKLVLLLALTISVSAQTLQAWQSYGNFSAENITFINSTLAEVMALNGVWATKTKTISDRLNAKWDPAWNVVIILETGSQALNTTGDFRNVVYGYAFNDHWLWYNKYSSSGMPPSYYFYFSIIIWKDYNCDTWKLQGYNDPFSTSTKITAIKKAIRDLATNETNLYTDPWLFGFKAVNAVQALYASEAYTIVVYNLGSYFAIYGCVVNDVNEGGAQIIYDNNIFASNTKFAYTIMRIR